MFRTSRGMLAAYTLLGILTIIFNATGFMMSCVYLSVPQVLMIGYTSPIVTMAGSALVTGEKPTPVQVLSGFMVLLGLYIGFVMGTDKGGPISLVGVAWAIVPVTGSSGQALLSRRISKTEHPDPLLQFFFSHLFGGLLLIAGRTLWGGWSDLANLTPRAFALTQYPALMSGLIAYGLLFSALKHIPASLVSLICTMEIVFALMLTPLLVHQIPTMHEIMGCIIIIVAVSCSITKSGYREGTLSLDDQVHLKPKHLPWSRFGFELSDGRPPRPGRPFFASGKKPECTEITVVKKRLVVYVQSARVNTPILP